MTQLFTRSVTAGSALRTFVQRTRAASAAPRAPAARRRRGAGLAEILLAMVIFSLVATSYAAVTLRYATRMKTISVGAARSAALAEYINRLMAVPVDSLAARAGTFTTSTGPFPNTRTIAVTVSGNTRTVTLILTPTQSFIKPDTVVLTRIKKYSGNPLA
jgi:Tfp pilus assembly protein PilV